MKFDPKLLQVIILQGREHKAALLPPEIERGPLGWCFDWCALMAAKYPQYKYVEGVASDPETGQYILHAWLTDGKYAYDPTWQATNDAGEQKVLPVAYVGIEMNVGLVHKFMKKTGYQGVLANRDRAKDIYLDILDGKIDDSDFPTPEQLAKAMRMTRKAAEAKSRGMTVVQLSFTEASESVRKFSKTVKDIK